jgi:hypothetical protein
MSAPYAECDLDAIVAGVQRHSLQFLTLQIANITLEAVADALFLPSTPRLTHLPDFNAPLAAAASPAGAGIPAASEGPPDRSARRHLIPGDGRHPHL